MPRSGGEYHISKEVITEILSRLPVKTLVRFRRACKYWCALIGSSSFINKHLYHSNNNACLLIQHYNYSIGKYAFALFPDETIASVPPDYHDIDYFQIANNPPGIVGPFHGMFCLWDWNRIALWNPATREFRPLVVPHPDFPPYFRSFRYFFGLGLDIITNDYKLVWIRHFWDEKDDYPYIPRVVSVYTLSTDCWRLFEVEEPWNGAVHNSLCNTCLNGVYYWQTKDNDHSYMILSFDMHSETFQEVPTPPDFSISQWADLGLYNGSIAIFLYDPREVEKHFDIWLMKEEKCWTKHLTIGPLLNVDGPLGFLTNGDLLMETNELVLILYKPNTHDVKDLELRGSNYKLKVFIYGESLVSVKGGNDWGKEDSSFNMVRVQDYFT